MKQGGIGWERMEQGGAGWERMDRDGIGWVSETGWDWVGE